MSTELALRDVSTGTRREVVNVSTALDMETATVWLLRGDAPDSQIHCYLQPNGTFGLWTQAPSADAERDDE